MDINPKAPNNQDRIHRPHEAQEERRPKCGFFGPFLKEKMVVYDTGCGLLHLEYIHYISPKAQNTQDTIHRQHEAQEERRPKCGCFGPS